MYTLKTNHPIADTSPDHIYPKGVKNKLGGPDYSWKDGYNPFVDEVIKYFGTSSIKVLDLGAASGYLVRDFLMRECDAIGLEGSNWAVTNNESIWIEHNNSRLFTCDIGKPFTLHKDNIPVKFDLITAWEVIEHLPPGELSTFANNVYNHLSNDGIFVFSLSPWFEPSDADPTVNLHLSYKITSKKQWKEIFNQFDFVGPVTGPFDTSYHYIFKERYRGRVREREGLRHTFWSTLKKRVR